MKTTILILLLSFFVLGCSKDDNNSFTPTLPPITQTGENTFGCYANGVLITPREGTGTWMGPDPGMTFLDRTGDFYEIDVNDFASERTSSINLHIGGLDSIGIGQYIVNESNCSSIDSPETTNIFSRVWDYEDKIYKSYCSYENSGVINITRYDTKNGIISGTFNGRAVGYDDPTDTIEIIKGRFDINWKKLTPYTEFP